MWYMRFGDWLFLFPYFSLFPLKVKVLVSQLCPTLGDPMDCSLPGSSVHGILQARIQEWVAIPFSRGSSQCRNWTQFSCIVSRFLTIWATREALHVTGGTVKDVHAFVCTSLAAQWQRIHLQCRRLRFDSWVRKIPWRRGRLPTPVFSSFPGGSDGKESACNVGDWGSIPGLGRSPGEGNGNPLLYSWLENSTDREAWQATVHGVTNSQTGQSH